jgi:hypothetical protein
VGGDVLSGGSGTNTLMLTNAGSVNLGGVGNFATIDLFGGTNTVSVSADRSQGGYGANALRMVTAAEILHFRDIRAVANRECVSLKR